MRVLTILFLLFWTNSTKAQLLSWTPEFIRDTGTAYVEIIADASRGNKGLQGYSNLTDVYVHIGVITSLSSSPTDWKYVKFSSFNTPNTAARCTSLGSDRWKFDIAGGLRSFVNITNAGERSCSGMGLGARCYATQMDPTCTFLCTIMDTLFG